MEIKKLVCKVCGHEFAPEKKNRYVAKRPIPYQTTEYYDCYDCPVCGCQIVAKERFKAVDE